MPRKDRHHHIVYELQHVAAAYRLLRMSDRTAELLVDAAAHICELQAKIDEYAKLAELSKGA